MARHLSLGSISTVALFSDDIPAALHNAHSALDLISVYACRERERQQRRQLLRRGSLSQEGKRPGSGGQTPSAHAADRAASLPSEPQALASQSDDTRSEVSVEAQQRLNSQLGSSSQAPSSPAGSARMYPPEEEAAAQPPTREPNTLPRAFCTCWQPACKSTKPARRAPRLTAAIRCDLLD